MLRYQYSDRSRIESDRSSQVESASSSSQVEIIEPDGSLTIAGVNDDAPLITEDNQVSTDLSSASSTDKIADLESGVADVRTQVSAPATSDQRVISTSNAMIAKSYSSIPNGSVVYVEKVVCDPPLVYKTDALTSSIEKSYAESGKYRMASPDSIRKLRSNFEYQNVANNGDWGNLASLARAEKYDYVFYGAIGEQKGKKLLTYYLIKVSTGEIVWENTSSVI